MAQLQNEIELIRAQKAEIGRRQREEAASHRAHKVAREHEFRQLQRKEERTASQLARLELEYENDALIVPIVQSLFGCLLIAADSLLMTFWLPLDSR